MAGLMTEISHISVLVIMVAAAMIIGVGLAADDPDSAVAGIGCSPMPAYKYVNATAFTNNLGSVFQSLLSNLSSSDSIRYATSMQNKSGKTDPVYGLAVCRKYLTASECSECVKKAKIKVEASCPGSNGARIHMDGCFFRYENSSFYDQAVDGGKSSNCSSSNDSDPQKFPEKVQDLSTHLIANVSTNKGYAVGSMDGNLYGLAQCWPSLTIIECQMCLTQAQTLLLSCNTQSEGRGLEAGCFMRYSPYSFFTRNQTSSSSNNSTPSSSGKTSSKVRGIWETALFATLCLVFCGLISLD